MDGAVRAGGLVVLLSAAGMAEHVHAQSSTVIELRQYTLRPGQRDILIDLFEREFVESQEAHGMEIVGTFRDLDKPDRFVWIRGFSDMGARPHALDAFYNGPVWRVHRHAANATMVDSDNVLLLHAARPTSAFGAGGPPRFAPGSTERSNALVVANIYYFDRPVGPEFLEYFDHVVSPHLNAAGATVRAAYVSETAANNFPRLPIRERDHVFVWFARFPDVSNYQGWLKTLARSAEWRAMSEALRQKLAREPEVLRLQPTSRSALR
jgi:hypothetical protein